MAKDKIKIINKDEVDNFDPDLPEKGYKRNEELARREDELQEAIESAPEKYSIDPSKFKIDNEIASESHVLTHIKNAQPGFRYKWVNKKFDGQQVYQAKYFGWQVVQGNDPECPNNKEADGTRVIGDTLLMRISEEKYQEIIQKDKEKRERFQNSITSNLQIQAAKTRGAVNFLEGEDAKKYTGVSNAAARKTVQPHVDRMIKEGTVPGMPAPGKRG